MTIPAVGPITALDLGAGSWRCAAVLVDQESHQLLRLCGAEKSSGNTVQRTPLSKTAQQASCHRQRCAIRIALRFPCRRGMASSGLLRGALAASINVRL